jgi:hypothetical protein
LSGKFDEIKRVGVTFIRKKLHTGVQRINNVFHIVNKVENVCVFQYILNLIDNVEYIVYALYSRISKTISFTGVLRITKCDKMRHLSYKIVPVSLARERILMEF